MCKPSISNSLQLVVLNVLKVHKTNIDKKNDTTTALCDNN